MKKLLLAAIFSVGLFSMAQSQILDYYIYNASSTNTWNFGMDDAVGTPIYELNIAPNDLRTGTNLTFGFPLEWKAEDSNNCGVYQFVGGPTGVITAPTSCTGVNATYQVGVIIPFVYHYLKLELP